MNPVIGKILAMLGWKKLIRIGWDMAYPELKKRAESTKDKEWDDELLNVANEIVKVIVA